jgi:hypothetical protein
MTTTPRFVPGPHGLRLATRFVPGAGPALVFLPGYMSDMAGSKAQAVFDWAMAQAPACCSIIPAAACPKAILPRAPFRAGAAKSWH